MGYAAQNDTARYLEHRCREHQVAFGTAAADVGDAAEGMAARQAEGAEAAAGLGSWARLADAAAAAGGVASKSAFSKQQQWQQPLFNHNTHSLLVYRR